MLKSPLTYCLFFLLIAKTSVAQVNFSASVTSGCGPLNVQFSDSSKGAASWSWDFGNGNQSILQNPSAIYNVSGSYTVKLSIKDKAGNVFTKTRTDYIRVYEGPKVNFSVTKRKLCPNDTLTFINQSTKGDADFKSWIWNFGDGNSSEATNPVHKYGSAGYRNITLLITDKNSCVATKKYVSYIQIWAPPVSDFTQDSSLSCKRNTLISFKSAASPSGLYHNWSFGTGDVSTAINPKYNYKQFGKYTVSLTVTDDNGCKGIKTVNQSVIIDSVGVDFSAEKSYVCDTSSVVKFINQSNVSVSYKWNWDFGDGNLSNAFIPVHSYASFGSFPVSLTVTGPGCLLVKRKQAYIKILRNPPLNITFNDTGACQIPFDIKFRTNTSVTATSIWDFGDGLTGTGNAPVHRYFKDDTFTVSVKTTESNGCSVLDTIRVFKNSLLTFAKGELSGCVPFKLELQSRIYETTAPLISEKWYLKNTVLDTGKYLSHTFSDTGVFKIKYMGLNSKFCADTPFYTIKVGNRSYPKFTLSKNTLCIHDSITAINQTPDPDNKLLYYWNNSEAFEGKGRNFTCRFHSTQGLGSIRLISEDNGCRDTIIDKTGVFVLSPMVGIKVPKLGCLLPAQIPIVNTTTSWSKFRWVSDPPPFKKSNDTMWLLPDSNKVYSLELYAKNDTTGCEDSFKYSLFLKPNTPKAKIKGGLTVACLPAFVALKDAGSSGREIFWKSPFDTAKLYGQHFNAPISDYGIYPILRIAVNQNEFQTCSDTAVYMAVIPKPDTRFSVSPASGCTPLKITLIDSGYAYARKASWQIGDSIIESKSKLNEFTIHTPSGPFGTNVSFIAYDSLHRCSDTSSRNIEVSGPEVEIQHNFLYNCKFTRLQLSYLQKTGKGIKSVAWYIDDTLRSNSVSTLHPVYNVRWVNVKLSVTDSAGCTSRFEKNIYTRVYKPLVKIGSDVNGAICPPVTVQFFDSTYSFNNPVEYWEWNFGDGTISNLKNPKHAFLNPGNYTITLKVKNLVGCFATDSFRSFIKVRGPNGEIKKPADSACVPRLTKFETTATGLRDILWDYGDGSEGNGVITHHIYKAKGSYRPSAILEDSAGCKTGITAAFTLYGLESPVAYTKQHSFCENAEIQFSDNSQYFGSLPKNRWSIYGNSTSGQIFSYKPFKFKKDTLLFIAHGKFGCNDTQVIYPVKSYVIPSYKILNDTLCLGDTLKLSNLSSSDTNITYTRWYWQNQQSKLFNATFKAEKTGHGKIVLVSGNAFGCMDSFIHLNQTVTGDTTIPASDGIKVLSVMPDLSLNVVLNSHKSFDWRAYHIYETGNLNRPLASSTKISDTVFNLKGLDVINQSYCIGVKNSNLCFRESSTSELKFHCQVNLKTKPDSGFINISWNAYSGLKPSEYRLYKNELNQPPQLVSSFTGLTHYTIDHDVKCHKIYSYRLETLFNIPGLVSSSDTAQAMPIYKNTLNAPVINAVSVLDKNSLELNLINQSKTHEIALWYLQKSIDGINFSNWKTITNSESGLVVDQNIFPSENRYYYRTFSKDVCKGISPNSLVHSPILLKANTINNSMKLQWNPYLNWPAGVDYYMVEIKNNNGNFTSIAKTSDTQILLAEIGGRCGEIPEFRVRAFSRPHKYFTDSLKSYESFSNIAAPTTNFFALAPNSFTPNNDGLNDVFKPEISWINTYRMFIYDRWGGKIFETEGCGSYWDGQVNGEPAAPGVYAYRLEIKGSNGGKQYLSGNVLLLN